MRESELHRELSISARVLEASLALGQAVSTELQMESLCDLVVEHLQEVFQAVSVALLFLDEESGELHEKRVRGPRRDWRALVEGKAEEMAFHSQRLVAESKVKGVVVLTWSPESGRPTAEDTRMVEVLGAQVAAAIDNAWLYGRIHQLNESLEEKVRERTHELEQAQLQLVQSEKMASLGQLTAGIAHEINNPLAYVINNVALAKERAALLERYGEILRTQLELARTRDPADRLARVKALAYPLQEDRRWREDVTAFRSELEALEASDPAAAAALGEEFLQYLRLCHEESAGVGKERKGVVGLLERGHQGLERVKQIVLDLRSFSRLDEAQYQEVELDSSIAGTLSIVEHLAKDRQVRLVQERGLGGPYACFPAKLNQVVLNLVTNALQATPPGGTVTVRTSDAGEGPLIEVQDTGKGIPPEALTKIFDPFFTTKPVGQGTGLGLSISYKIIEEHGGTIRVTSKIGEGTRFSVQLPARAGASAEQR
ncbi:MAG: ATP-binding protein [Deltaproteobacteria bacterium]|nr:ATP-binding protein [Deltaproteobacteria bacterium]